jgi:hypothetical protein
MISDSGIVCNSKAAATAALETIASTFLRGTQRDALIAVINWIEENFPKDFSEETKERIQKIYDDLMDEANRKFTEWEAHGGEPPDGARAMVPFLYSAERKAWLPEHGLPPVQTEEHYSPQCELDGDDEGIE